MRNHILTLLLLLSSLSLCGQTVYTIAEPASPMAVREGHLNLGGKTLSVPVGIAKDEVAILPLNFRMGRATLSYATAQPLMRVGDHYFFFAPEGMQPEFVFADGRRFRPEAGFGSTFRHKGVSVTTLTRAQAEKVGARRYTVRFDAAPGADVQEYFLRLAYTGDVAIGFLENRVVADNLWQGSPWLIGLNRFRDGMSREPLGFYFRPLRRDAAFLETLPQEIIPDLSRGPVLSVDAVEVIPQYRCVVRP